MENNANISARLESLLNVLDARKFVEVFREIDTQEMHGQELLRSTPLFYLLSDQEFLGKYGGYKVVGLRIDFTLSVLIREAE